jgi:hypothetical protein
MQKSLPHRVWQAAKRLKFPWFAMYALEYPPTGLAIRDEDRARLPSLCMSNLGGPNTRIVLASELSECEWLNIVFSSVLCLPVRAVALSKWLINYLRARLSM